MGCTQYYCASIDDKGITLLKWEITHFIPNFELVLSGNYKCTMAVLTIPQLLQSWTEVTENYEDINGINKKNTDLN